MTVQFRLDKHLIEPSRDVIEVWSFNKYLASIYPTDKGIKIISKHKMNILQVFEDTIKVDIND